MRILVLRYLKVSEVLTRIEDNQNELRREFQELLVKLTESNAQLRIHNAVLFSAESGLMNRVWKVERWKSRLGGIWVAVAIGSVALSTIAGLIIAYIKS